MNKTLFINQLFFYNFSIHELISFFPKRMFSYIIYIYYVHNLYKINAECAKKKKNIPCISYGLMTYFYYFSEGLEFVSNFFLDTRVFFM